MNFDEVWKEIQQSSSFLKHATDDDEVILQVKILKELTRLAFELGQDYEKQKPNSISKEN